MPRSSPASAQQLAPHSASSGIPTSSANEHARVTATPPSSHPARGASHEKESRSDRLQNGDTIHGKANGKPRSAAGPIPVGSTGIEMNSSPPLLRLGRSRSGYLDGQGEVEDRQNGKAHDNPEDVHSEEIQAQIHTLFPTLDLRAPSVELAYLSAAVLNRIPPTHVPQRTIMHSLYCGLHAIAALIVNAINPSASCPVHVKERQAAIYYDLVDSLTNASHRCARIAYLSHYTGVGEDERRLKEEAKFNVDERSYLSEDTLSALLVHHFRDSRLVHGFRLYVVSYDRLDAKVTSAYQAHEYGDGHHNFFLRRIGSRWEPYLPTLAEGDRSSDGKPLNPTRFLRWWHPIFNNRTIRPHSCDAGAIEEMRADYEKMIASQRSIHAITSTLTEASIDRESPDEDPPALKRVKRSSAEVGGPRHREISSRSEQIDYNPDITIPESDPAETDAGSRPELPTASWLNAVEDRLRRLDDEHTEAEPPKLSIHALSFPEADAAQIVEQCLNAPHDHQVRICSRNVAPKFIFLPLVAMPLVTRLECREMAAKASAFRTLALDTLFSNTFVCADVDHVKGLHRLLTRYNERFPGTVLPSSVRRIRIEPVLATIQPLEYYQRLCGVTSGTFNNARVEILIPARTRTELLEDGNLSQSGSPDPVPMLTSDPQHLFDQFQMPYGFLSAVD